MDRLTGKTCIVTAAGQGIGRAIAEAFLGEGAQVIATDMRSTSLDQLAEHRKLERAVLDVTDQDAIRRLAKDHPEVDVLANCVGYVAHGTILDDGVATLRSSLDVNVCSMAAMIAAFLPAMLERGRGAIVNIASVVSSVKSAPDRFAYATSKAAVIGLTRSVARDFAARGVRCNSISPGTVDTPSLRMRVAATARAETAMGEFVARQPMGRLGAAEEVAAVAVLLATDEATFMTGANVVIDGGMSL